jgi:hypothetical protein
VGYHSHSSSRPSPSHHQNLHQKLFFSDDNNKAPRNQIFVINSFNRLTRALFPLHEQTEAAAIGGQTQRGIEAQIRRGANIVLGIVRRTYRSYRSSFENQKHRTNRITASSVPFFHRLFLRDRDFGPFFRRASPGFRLCARGLGNHHPICPTYWPKLKQKWNGASRINRTKHRLAIVI